MRLRTTLLLIFIGLLSFAQEALDQNKTEINNLQNELRELDNLLSTHKQQEAKKDEVLVSSDLDEETKAYIKKVADNYFDGSAASAKDLEFLKGQLDLLRKSMADMKTESVINNVQVKGKLDDINNKLGAIDTEDNESITDLKTSMISLKATILAMQYGNPTEDGSQAQVIAQQAIEVELLKEEISKLRRDIESEKNELSTENLKRFEKLMEENFRLQNTVKTQQIEINNLKNQLIIAQTNTTDSSKIEMLINKIDELKAENERNEIVETISDLDILETKLQVNKKLDKLSLQFDDLKSFVTSGKDPKMLEGLNFNIDMGGYYVVIASRRSQKAIEMAQQDFERRGYKGLIEKNELETWFHLVVERLDTRNEAGASAREYRKKGIDGAWWLYKVDNNVNDSSKRLN